MKTVLLFLLLAAVAPSFTAESALQLDSNLKVLEPFLGGGAVNSRSTPENPMFDVARWERALNGKAVRTIHSINDGIYGGESIVTWDAEKKEIRLPLFHHRRLPIKRNHEGERKNP